MDGRQLSLLAGAGSAALLVAGIFNDVGQSEYVYAAAIALGCAIGVLVAGAGDGLATARRRRAAAGLQRRGEVG